LTLGEIAARAGLGTAARNAIKLIFKLKKLQRRLFKMHYRARSGGFRPAANPGKNSANARIELGVDAILMCAVEVADAEPEDRSSPTAGGRRPVDLLYTFGRPSVCPLFTYG
jgi:hypothetical protein